MKIDRFFLELLEKYGVYQECGSDKMENGSGKLIIEENLFIRKKGGKMDLSIADMKISTGFLNIKIADWY